jgi:hypothetical protein
MLYYKNNLKNQAQTKLKQERERKISLLDQNSLMSEMKQNNNKLFKK